MEFPSVPKGVVAEARAVCLALPEVVEIQTDPGYEFKIRRRTFAYVFAVADPTGREIPMVVCRADPEEREVLLAIGHPFFAPRSGADRVGVVLDATTDWSEIGELLTDSYRLLAPKKLADLVGPPPPP